MIIGKIVTSDSHISYVCQIYGPHDVESEPAATDYAFGRFVRATTTSDSLMKSETRTRYIVGVIYDTHLLNPTFGTLRDHLSTREQSKLFSPDSLVETAVVTSILLLGTLELERNGQDMLLSYTAMQGIPPFSLELGDEIETMSEEEIRAFHFFPEAGIEELHMSYLPVLLAQGNSLLPLVVLQIIERVEQLFPDQTAMLGIVKRNVAWNLKVRPTG